MTSKDKTYSIYLFAIKIVDIVNSPAQKFSKNCLTIFCFTSIDRQISCPISDERKACDRKTRYDNLASHFTEQNFPGVGGSIGLTRLFYVLNEYNLLPENSDKILDYAIVPISENEYDYAFSVADRLRKKGSSVTVVLTDKKLGDKLTYAAKLAKNGIVIGESEASSNQLQVKDFTTGETTDLNLDA